MTEASTYDPHENLRPPQSSLQEGRPIGRTALKLAQNAADQHGNNPELNGPYPDLTFDIDEELFTSNGVIEKPLISHTRQILRIVNDISSEQLGESLDYHIREPHQRRVVSFLAQTVVIGSTKPHRRDIVNHSDAVQVVRAQLKAVKHPVEQVLAKAEVKLKDVLSPQELKSLPLDVLKITHWSALREQYHKQISARRESRL